LPAAENDSTDYAHAVSKAKRRFALCGDLYFSGQVGKTKPAGSRTMGADRPFEERRRASRFGRNEDADFASLELPSGEEVIAMVFDESLGGISLFADAAWPLAVGSVVKIAYAGSIFTATVKHMRLLDDGVRRIVGFATAPR
jgi:hypothetical protein